MLILTLPICGLNNVGTSILTTLQKYSIDTIYDVMQLSLDSPKKTIIIAAEERSGSSATANHALRQGRQVIITRHVAAKIEGATIVENPGELKDALSMDREDSEK